MEYKDLTETIIGCAYHVYNKMGFGFRVTKYLVNPVILSRNLE